MLRTPSPFVFAVAQPAAVPALKEEVAREHSELTFAYSRPGLVTFKSSKGDVPPDFELSTVFARVWGASSGPTEDPAEVRAYATAVGGGKRVRLHVFERDGTWVGEPPPQAGVLAAAVRARLAGAPFLEDERAEPGDLVVDVIVAPDEPWWIGSHRHVEGRWQWPGGRLPEPTPAEAPSRAWRKMAEGLAWSGAPLGRGDVVLQFGGAPGGASYALLQRGADVVAVDPEPMSPTVLNWDGEGSFVHVPRTIGALERLALPERCDWIVLDVGIAPQVAIRSMQRFFPPFRKTLRGVMFTLKLNDWSVATDLPSLLERIRELGLTQVRATHLPSDRQEVFVMGLTRLGLERLQSRGGLRRTGPPKPPRVPRRAPGAPRG